MANMLFANNANTTLASSLTNSATTISVVSASAFPSPTGSQYFYCTLADAATQTTIEIVKVTAVSGTTFTIVRGQDGTSGTAFASGAVVSLRLVRASLNDFPKLDETNTFTADQAITGQLTTSAGLATTSTFTATPPADGLVMDYATGYGRFSAFAGDGFQWYNAGVANTKLMQLSSTGVITTATWNGATIGTGYGGTGLTSFTSNGIIYASSSSVLANSSALTFDGTNFATTGYASATSFRPTSSTVPTNGMYLSGTNTLGWATNSTAQASLDANGNLSSKAFYQTSTTLYGMTLATLAPAFNFDAATCAVTVTSGNSISFSNVFSGVIMVTDTGYSGCTAVLICGGGGTLVLGNSTTTQYFTNSSIAGDYRFYSTGGAYQLFASARTTTFKIISFRTQNST